MSKTLLFSLFATTLLAACGSTERANEAEAIVEELQPVSGDDSAEVVNEFGFWAAEEQGVHLATVQVEDREPWRAIIATAEAKGADLIVMASHGRRGVSALVLGSETQKLLTHSTVPVLVFR